MKRAPTVKNKMAAALSNLIDIWIILSKEEKGAASFFTFISGYSKRLLFFALRFQSRKKPFYFAIPTASRRV